MYGIEAGPDFEVDLGAAGGTYTLPAEGVLFERFDVDDTPEAPAAFDLSKD